MNYQFLAALSGNSGSLVSKVKYKDRVCVLKQGHDNFANMASQYQQLQRLGLAVPEVYDYSKVHLLIEYIPGLSMYEYFTKADPADFINYTEHLFNQFESKSILYDFSKEYDDKFAELENSIPPDVELPFTLHELKSYCPTIMPKGICHGDLSLENILYRNDFYLIDCDIKDLNSWWLDAAKLCQDLDAYWFLRSKTVNIEYLDKLQYISHSLKNKIKPMNSPALVCFMLTRVLPYCRNDADRKFIIDKLKLLWI